LTPTLHLLTPLIAWIIVTRATRRSTVACILLLTACSDTGTGPEGNRSPPTACAPAGGLVQGSAAVAEWVSGSVPYQIEENITIGALRIGPGVRVCVAPGATLTVADLVAVGTSTDSILFLPDEESGTWGGITVSVPGSASQGTGRMQYVRMEGAGIRSDRSLHIESSVIRGGNVALAGTMRDVLVDGGSISVPAYASGDLENVTVRASPGAGVSTGRRSSLRLSSVRIEGSAGPGLDLYAHIDGATSLTIDGPLRITGGGSYPVYGPIYVLDELLPDAGASDSLTGNARDMLMLTLNGRHTRPLTIDAALPWQIVRGSGCACGSFGPIHMEPGSSLAMAWVEETLQVDRLSVAGTAENRASIVADAAGSPAALHIAGGEDTSVLTGLRLENVQLSFGDSVPVILDNVVARRASIRLDAPGSRVSDLWLDEALAPGLVLGPGAVLERATVMGALGDAVRVQGAGVRISDCTIGNNNGHGVLIETGDAVISRCSLLAGGRNAVHNASASVVDARNNWWGRASGPDSPGAGTVSDAVNVTPYLTHPPQTGSTEAVSLDIAGTATVATSDTVHLSAEVRDSAGALLPLESVHWSVADPAIADVFANGTILGRSPGQTVVTAMVRGDTTVRSSRLLDVTAGAPVFDWTRYDLGVHLRSVWASGSTAFAGSSGGGIYHFDGASWSTQDEYAALEMIASLWGRGPADVYALSYFYSPPIAEFVARLHHFDGTAWSPLRDFPMFGGSVWGAGEADVFVGGPAGLWLFDGSEWEQLSTTAGGSVWARSPSDVYFATGQGVEHFDGVAIRNLGGPAEAELWGTATALFAAKGALFEYRAAGDWAQVPQPSQAQIHALTGTSGTDVFGLGQNSEILHHDGAVMRPVWLMSPPETAGSDIVADGPYVYLVQGNSVVVGIRRN
jgi:hypothetical protein